MWIFKNITRKLNFDLRKILLVREDWEKTGIYRSVYFFHRLTEPTMLTLAPYSTNTKLQTQCGITTLKN